MYKKVCILLENYVLHKNKYGARDMTNTNTKLVTVGTSGKSDEAWGRKERCSLFFF